MDEYGHLHDRHLRAVDPDDMDMDDLPMDLDACERLEREARRRDSLLVPLVTLVGDEHALFALDADPVPDEPFAWSDVEPADRAFVTEIVTRTDRACDLLLDVEFRTITRRLVARVARRDPRALRRGTNVARAAAAFVWLAGRASGEFGRRGPRPSHSLWDWFGVSNASDRAYTLRRAAGLEPNASLFDPWTDELSLGDASLLHSRFRAQILRRRDAVLELERGRQRWHPRADGTVEITARPAAVVVAGRGTEREAGVPKLLLGLGDNVDDADYFALTIAEAKSLVARVQSALDGRRLSG